jgi:hypothetical protein
VSQSKLLLNNKPQQIKKSSIISALLIAWQQIHIQKFIALLVFFALKYQKLHYTYKIQATHQKSKFLASPTQPIIQHRFTSNHTDILEHLLYSQSSNHNQLVSW